MKKNDTFILKIEDMGIGGEGIGKYEGMTFFVKDAVIGDEILAGVTKLKKGYGYARLVEIVKPSPKRVEAPCKIARQCRSKISVMRSNWFSNRKKSKIT